MSAALASMRRVAAVEKAEAEKLQVVMAAQGDAEAKYLQGQARPPAWSPAPAPSSTRSPSTNIAEGSHACQPLHGSPASCHVLSRAT